MSANCEVTEPMFETAFEVGKISPDTVILEKLPEKLLKKISECKEDKLNQTFNLNDYLNAIFRFLKHFPRPRCKQIRFSIAMNSRHTRSGHKRG